MKRKTKKKIKNYAKGAGEILLACYLGLCAVSIVQLVSGYHNYFFFFGFGWIYAEIIYFRFIKNGKNF